jgi:hypothetical protein
MRARNWSIAGPLLALLAAAVLSGCNSPAGGAAERVEGTSGESPQSARPQERGGQEEFGPYEVVENWPQPLPDGPDGVTHAGWTWGSTGAVFAETPDRIWIAQRGELPLPPGARPFTPYSMLEPPRRATGNDDDGTRGWERRYHHVIFVVDRNGATVQAWPQHDKLFGVEGGRGPHKIKMSPYDSEKHVWVIDDNLHVIHKFTYDGKLVMTLGQTGVAGRGPNNFSRPTDIAWLPDGTFFISDGYVGVRVAKFDPSGKFLMDWGTAPKDATKPGPNEFDTVHSIAISDDRRLFVADRGHRRFQVFDENGKFLDMWTTGVRSLPYSHLITADQALWVSDGGTDRILKYDLNGNYRYGWGGPGGGAGQFSGPHQMTVDQDRNLYVAEVFNGRVQKFRPKQNADPDKIIGQEKRFGVSATN